MSKQPTDELTAYLVDQLPLGSEEALRIVAELDYPIPDRCTWVTACRKVTKGQSAEVLARLNQVEAALRPTDFPILTARSALEKLGWRIPPIIWPEWRWRIPDPRESIQAPGVSDVYVREFGEHCGQVALEAYADALRDGLNDLQATVIGTNAGLDCFQNLPPDEQERIRRNRRRR